MSYTLQLFQKYCLLFLSLNFHNRVVLYNMNGNSPIRINFSISIFHVVNKSVVYSLKLIFVFRKLFFWLINLLVPPGLARVACTVWKPWKMTSIHKPRNRQSHMLSRKCNSCYNFFQWFSVDYFHTLNNDLCLSARRAHNSFEIYWENDLENSGKFANAVEIGNY